MQSTLRDHVCFAEIYRRETILDSGSNSYRAGGSPAVLARRSRNDTNERSRGNSRHFRLRRLSGSSKLGTANGRKPELSPAISNEPAAAEKLRLARPEVVPDLKEHPDVPVFFYGLVMDQDSNALPNVKVDVEITQWNFDTPSDSALKGTHVKKQTDTDGRFEVSGVKGHWITVKDFSKDGYEAEFRRRDYGQYPPQSGNPDDPKAFRMWSTNLHESLIAGEKKFEIKDPSFDLIRLVYAVNPSGSGLLR
jgi:hypothetical protein